MCVSFPEGERQMRPETRYARSGDVHIAYQTLGRGPFDIVFVHGFISNVDIQWEEPRLRHLLSRLASFARVIVFDKRGTGLSDRTAELPGLETRMQDVRAVMDAAGCERAALIGASEGGPLSILFAATYPHRTRAVVLYGAYARFRSAVMDEEQVESFVRKADQSWGTGESLQYFAPGLVDDDRFRQWWARFERLSASPAAAIALARMNSLIDVRNVLPAVRVPTLVIHRRDDVRVRVDAGRELAALIPGARYVEVPGTDHPIWVGDVDRVIDEIESFLTGTRPLAEPQSVLLTLLVVRAAEARLLAASSPSSARAAWDVALDDFRGRERFTESGHVLATFEGPVRALRCALGLRERLADLGIYAAIGVHTGELEIQSSDRALGGVTVDTACAVAEAADMGEVLVSAIVRDLVAGAGVRLQRQGELPADDQRDPVVLFSATTGSKPASDRPDSAASTARPDSSMATLSAREREVVALVARGLTNREIAGALSLSEHTVKRHVANVLMKLDLPTRAAVAARFASGRQLAGN